MVAELVTQSGLTQADREWLRDRLVDFVVDWSKNDRVILQVQFDKFGPS